MVFVTQNQPKNFVAVMTGGRFDHVLLCSDPSPPGRFIEAVGITGEPGDTMGDRVRRATAARYAVPGASLRVVHPPVNTERAINFAATRLGKPYNYAFDDALGGDRARSPPASLHRPGKPLDPPWPNAIIPPNGHFTAP